MRRMVISSIVSLIGVLLGGCATTANPPGAPGSRFRDCPDPPPPGMIAPGSEDKVMHAAVRIGETMVMASDGDCRGSSGFQGFSLSITAADEAEADRLFAALSEGGQVQMPMGATFFSPRFGMTADRFGVSWMVIVMP